MTPASKPLRGILRWVRDRLSAAAPPPALAGVPQAGGDLDVPVLFVSAQRARWLAMNEPAQGQRGLPRGGAHRCRSCGGALAPILLSTWGTAAWEAVPIATDGWRCQGCGAVSMPALLTPEQVQRLCAHGAMAAQQERLEAAAFFFRRVCSSWPEYSFARMQLGTVYLDQRSRSRDSATRAALSERALQEMLAASSGRPAPHPWVALSLAQLLTEQQAYPQARAQLQRFWTAEAIPPPLQESASALGEVLDRLDRYHRGAALIAVHLDAGDTARLREGIVLLERFASDAPQHWRSRWLLGRAHRALGDLLAARRWLSASWSLNPGEARVGQELAVALMATRCFEEALPVLRASLATAPGDARLLSRLALGLLLAGRDVQAEEVAQTARLRAPEDDDIAALHALIVEVQCGLRARPTGMRADGALCWG